MAVIQVVSRFGPICVSSEEGAKLCALIRESFEKSETVTLDFSGVTTLASLFLNNAVGCLYAYHSKEFLEERLSWTGLDPADESVIRFVKRNAIRFYTSKVEQQEALVAAAAHSTEE